MFRWIVAGLLLVVVNGMAAAQVVEPTTDFPVQRIRKHSVSDWPETTRAPFYDHALKLVFRNAEKPAKCNVQQITSTAIFCKTSHHKIIRYSSDDVDEILDPPYHGELGFYLIFWTVLGCAFAGSFFVPLGWSVALRVLVPIFTMLPDDGIPSGDHSREIVIYQRAESTLAIHPRG